MSNENQNNIHDQLRGFIRKFHLRDILNGTILNFALFLSLLFVFAGAEYVFEFGNSSRLFLLLSFTLIQLITLVRFVLIPVLKFFNVIKGKSFEEASVLIGNHFPEIKDQLTNLLQLEKEESNNELISASIQQKAKRISPFNFKDAVLLNDLLGVVKWATLPLVLVVGVSIWDASIITKGATRIVKFNEDFAPENPFKFKVINNNMSAIRHDNFNFQIEFISNQVPNDVYVVENGKNYRLEKKSISKFEYDFRNIQSDINFKIKTGEFFSQNFKINLIEKPTVTNFHVALNFPKYTKIQPNNSNNQGDFTVPEGTEIEWTINSDFTDEILFQTKDTVLKLSSENTETKIKNKILSNFKYSITPNNKEGISGDKMDYNISVIKDEHPRIKIKNIIDSINPMMLFHSGIIADDYGFSNLQFVFESKDTTGKISIPIPSESLQHQFNHGMNVKDLGFKIGDELSYYFVVFDNDGVNGSKSSKSSKLTYKIPSQKTIEDLLDKNNESIKDQISKNMEEAQELQKQFENIQKILVQKKNMDWQDKSRIEQFLNQQKHFEEKLEKLKFDQQKNNFQKDQLSPQEEEILKKQEQINQLFDELLDEETKKLYEELEKLMEDFNEEKVKKTIEEINLSNEELEKELDRTLEMFKQMEFDEKLENTINKLDELSKEQEKLSEETKENSEISDEELQNKQEEINNKFEDIQKDIEDLKKKNEELENPRKLEDTQEQQDAVKQEQQKSKEQLQNKQKNKASKSQKKASDQMQQLYQKMQQMQKNMEMEGQMEDINSLRQILENLISLSVEQEDLMQNIKKVNRFDPQFPVLATKQGDLKESAKIIEDSLTALSKRQMAIQSIVNKELLDIKYNMDKSIDLLRERQNFNAAVKQQYVMTSANNLALLLDESLQQMQQQMMQSKMPGAGSCNKPGGSNPKAGMPNLSKMQQQLSEQLKKMMEEMKNGNQPGKDGKKGKSGMAKSLAQMSAQQSKIKEQLKKLNENQKKQGNNGLGDFKDLLNKLEENERDILNKNITRETIIRQEQIMDKLLKAENAMRERELDEKRKSNSAKNDFSRNPSDFTPYKSFELKEKEELKTIPSSFNLYYKRKISEYFNTFEE